MDYKARVARALAQGDERRWAKHGMGKRSYRRKSMTTENKSEKEPEWVKVVKNTPPRVMSLEWYRQLSLVRPITTLDLPLGMSPNDKPAQDMLKYIGQEEFAPIRRSDMTEGQQVFAVDEETGEMLDGPQDEGAETLPVVREAEIVQVTPSASPQPLSIQEFEDRIALVRRVVETMQDGVHYGRIPGSNGRSLWEPGAEYLRMAFNIGWDYEIVDAEEDTEKHVYSYTVRAHQLTPAGVKFGGWIASATSRERKFYCRGGSQEKGGCPRQCKQEHPPLGMEAAMLPHNVRDRAIKRAFVAMIRNATGTTGYFQTVGDGPGR